MFRVCGGCRRSPSSSTLRVYLAGNYIFTLTWCNLFQFCFSQLGVGQGTQRGKASFGHNTTKHENFDPGKRRVWNLEAENRNQVGTENSAFPGTMEASLSTLPNSFSLNSAGHLSYEIRHEEKQVILSSFPDTVLMSVYVLPWQLTYMGFSLGHIIL